MWLKNVNIKEGIWWEISLPPPSNPILFKEEITILIYPLRIFYEYIKHIGIYVLLAPTPTWQYLMHMCTTKITTHFTGNCVLLKFHI